ncbi:MAG: hypothetical protein N2689_05835 [Verrucomicrobiae bacterium]|nr:hypothetical protein [Verrucomicrobiae bacterium]
MRQSLMVVCFSVAGMFAGWVKAAEEKGAAPANPYNGMQEREEVFEFTQKPKVEKQEDKWVITFASRGKCDATVTIRSKEGRVLRHLASGVLGPNAPWPFQQNSLSQRIEWDGAVDFEGESIAGAEVHVGLGLKAMYDKSINWNPNLCHGGVVFSGTGPNKENVYVGMGSYNSGHMRVREFDKSGKYLKTLCPPPAKELKRFCEALGLRVATTKWGDEIVVSPPDYYWAFPNYDGRKGLQSAAATMTAVGLSGIEQAKEPPSFMIKELDGGRMLSYHKRSYVCADPWEDKVYFFAVRFDGATGKADESWPYRLNPELIGLVRRGPDKLLYGMDSGYGQHLWRWEQDGKWVPFKNNWTVAEKSSWGHPAYYAPPPYRSDKARYLFFKEADHQSATQNGGLCVAPNGLICGARWEVSAGWVAKHGGTPIKANGDTRVIVFDREGNLVTVDALGFDYKRGSAFMDRHYNIYVFMPGGAPPNNELYGVSGMKTGEGLVKVRGQGGRFPLAKYATEKLKVMRGEIPGGLWSFPTATKQRDSCNCPQIRSDIDWYGRLWVPANYMHSVLAIDSNGNVIARIGRYGNVDDSEEDIKNGTGDGVRFCWLRAVSANAWALYAADYGSCRVLRAKLYYSAEETVPLP